MRANANRGRSLHRRGCAFAIMLAAGIGLANTTAAQEVMARAGDWEYGADAELAAASTRNAEGSLFGLVCSPNCVGFIETERPCDEGRAYDATMSSPGRADMLRLECRRLEARYAMLFTPSPAFIETLRNGPEVRVTVRREGLEDSVFSFSLNGAYDAVYVTLATAIAASGEEQVATDPAT